MTSGGLSPSPSGVDSVTRTRPGEGIAAFVEEVSRGWYPSILAGENAQIPALLRS